MCFLAIAGTFVGDLHNWPDIHPHLSKQEVAEFIDILVSVEMLATTEGNY